MSAEGPLRWAPLALAALMGCETERLSLQVELPVNTDLAVVWVFDANGCVVADLASAPVVAVIQRAQPEPLSCGEVNLPPGRYVAVAAGFLSGDRRCDAHSYGCMPFEVGRGPVPTVVVPTTTFSSIDCERAPFCAPYATLEASCRDAMLEPCEQIAP